MALRKSIRSVASDPGDPQPAAYAPARKGGRAKKVAIILLIVAIAALIAAILLNDHFHWWVTLPW